jgi:antitoxin component HigA of HigAB toxin-antitoxin module
MNSRTCSRVRKDILITNGRGLSPHDLAPFIGGRNRFYEVLVRKRPLTLKMIWRFDKGARDSGRVIGQAWQQLAA